MITAEEARNVFFFVAALVIVFGLVLLLGTVVTQRDYYKLQAGVLCENAVMEAKIINANLRPEREKIIIIDCEKVMSV